VENDKPMYPVKIPNGLMSYFAETGVMQGSDKDERPCVRKELEGLKWTGKGATGEVSLYTLGWIADQTENGFLEVEADSASPSALKAAQAAAARYAEAYEGGRKAEGPEEPEGIRVAGTVVPPSFGLPVYHVRDKSRVVGFLTPGSERFVPVENLESEMTKANE